MSLCFYNEEEILLKFKTELGLAPLCSGWDLLGIPKKQRFAVCWVTLTCWTPSENTLVWNIIQIRSVWSNIWFHHAIVFMGRASINTAEVPPWKLSSSAPRRCELQHLHNTIAINCMFNKEAGLAGTFWRAGIGVPATCKTSLAQEQWKSHNWIVKM